MSTSNDPESGSFQRHTFSEGQSSPPPSPWLQEENPALSIMLDGFFYLKDSSSMQPRINLQQLLHTMSVSTIEKGLNRIAGGMYALIILDKERQLLHLCTDQGGYMPLYYLDESSTVHFSGNPFTFAERCAIWEPALIEFLKFGYLPFSDSFFEGVKRVLPGQMVTVALEEGSIVKTPCRVQEFPGSEMRIDNPDEAAGLLYDVLEKYFQRFSRDNIGILFDNEPTQMLSAAALKSYPLTFFCKRPLPNKLKEQLNARSHQTSILPTQPSTPAQDLFYSGRLAISQEHQYRLNSLYPMIQKGVSLLLDDTSAPTWLMNPQNNGWSNISGFDSPIQPLQSYQHLLYNLPGALPDEALAGIMTTEFEVWFLNNTLSVLESNRTAGDNHCDFLESLQRFTAGRSLNNASFIYNPGSLRQSSVFNDYAVQAACRNIHRSVKQGDLLGHLLTSYYPDYRDLARQLHSQGKWKKLRAFFSKWGKSPPQSTSKDLSLEIFSLIEAMKGVRQLPDVFLKRVETFLASGNPNPLLRQRLITLFRYFEPNA